jgi:hypothetical protein
MPQRTVIVVIAVVVVPFLTEDEPSTPTTRKHWVKATEYEAKVLSPRALPPRAPTLRV